LQARTAIQAGYHFSKSGGSIQENMERGMGYLEAKRGLGSNQHHFSQFRVILWMASIRKYIVHFECLSNCMQSGEFMKSLLDNSS
jgi:hypothetical protein